MAKKMSITKFEINEKSFYVKVSWKPNDNDLFNIKIYDGDTTWSGHFSHEFARKYRERFDETEEQYYNNVKKGLSKDHEFSYSFVLQKDDESSATFSWKKKFEDSQTGIAVLVHGSVPVHRDEIKETKDFLLDFLLAENQALRDTVETLNARNEVLTLDLEKCRSDLDRFVDVKTSLETSLYGKFVQLLSAKKRRIELLEESISKISSSNVNKVGDDID